MSGEPLDGGHVRLAAILERHENQTGVQKVKGATEMEMTQRHDLIEELHNLDFEDGPLDNTGWRLKRYADGASVWFNAAGQFILRMPTENYSGLASEPKHILDLIAAHFQE